MLNHNLQAPFTTMKRFHLGIAFLFIAAMLPSNALAQKNSDVRVDTDWPKIGNSILPQIAASGDSVYVVWEDDRFSPPDIPCISLPPGFFCPAPRIWEVYFNRSLDGGATWLPRDIRLPTYFIGSTHPSQPQIAASGDSVYAVWTDRRSAGYGGPDIHLNRSLDRGTTWLTADIRLDTDMPGAARSIDPQIVASGNSVYVVWRDARNSSDPVNGPFDLYFNRSLDGGATWLTSDIRLDTDLPGSATSWKPQIAAAGNSVYVVWEDLRNRRAPVFGHDIYFNRSIDGGTTWLSSDIRLNTDSPGANYSGPPQIAASESSVYVTWSDPRNGGDPNRGPFDIYFNRSLDDGATWLTSDMRLGTDLPGATGSGGSQIVASGDSVWVTWIDGRNGSADVYFNRSKNRGATWLDSDIRLDTDLPGTAWSNYSQIAISDDSVYVSWRDDRNSDSSNGDSHEDPGSIYFNRSVDGGTTWLTSDVRLDAEELEPPSAFHARMAASGDSVYVTWEDFRSGFSKRNIYLNIPFGAQPYGTGTVGSGGSVPRLHGTDSLHLGSTFTLTVTNGLGGAFGLLGLGGPNSKASIPSLGGIRLIDPVDLVLPILLNGTPGAAGTGATSIKFNIPMDNAFLGLNVNLQAVFFDPNARDGLALTNGVEAWIL